MNIDELYGQIVEVDLDVVYINCRLDIGHPTDVTYQLRKFNRILVENLERIEVGMFVKITIMSQPGSMQINITEEPNDISELFNQPEFFKSLEL